MLAWVLQDYIWQSGSVIGTAWLPVGRRTISCSLFPLTFKSFISKSNLVQFSLSIVSDSLWPCGLQHARLPCWSPTPRVYSDSCPLSQWGHPTISSSVVSFFSCLQSFPASGSFPMSQFFASGGQSIGVSASASVLSMNTQDWFPLGWTVGSPFCPRDSQESSSKLQFKSICSALSFLYSPTLTSIHDYWKNHSLTRWIFVGK